MKKTCNSELVNIGRAGSAVGLRGEFRVTLYSRDSDNLKEGKVLLLKHTANKRAQHSGGAAQTTQGNARKGNRQGSAQSAPQSSGHSSQKGVRQNSQQSSQEISAVCTGVRLQNGNPIVRLEGITDRTAAEALKGMEIYITPEELEELPEGEHYVRDIIGYTVRDIASGTDIGTLNDVIQNTAQSVLDIRTPEGRQVLVPAVDAFMRGIDDEAGVISVELIPGFL